MLDFFRRNSQNGILKYVFGALLFLLMLSFGAWGISDVIRQLSTSQTAPISIGKQTITAGIIQNAVRDDINRISAQTKHPFSTKDALKYGVVNQSIQQLIQKQMFNNEINSMMLTGSNVDVSQEIAKIPAFLNPSTGEFDEKIFKVTLKQNGLTESKFISNIKNTIALNQLKRSIQPLAIPFKSISKIVYNHVNKLYTIQVINIQNNMFKIPAISMDEQKKYYKEHTASYMYPEYRNASAIILDTNEVSKSINVSDEQVKQAYNDNISAYVRPERRSFKQFEFATEKEAKDFQAEVLVSDVYSSAKKYKISSVEFSLMTKEGLPANLQGIVFKTKENLVSDVEKVDDKFDVIYVTKIQKAQTATLESVKNDIIATIRGDKVSQRIEDMKNNALNMLGEGKKIEDIAKALKIKLHTFKNITKNNLDINGKPANVPVNILTKIFSGNATDELNFVPLTTTSYIALRVDNVVKAKAKDFKTVQAQVIKDAHEDKAQAQADKVVATIKDRIIKGDKFEKIASKYHLVTLKDVVGTGPIKGLNIKTKTHLFNQKNQIAVNTFNGVTQVAKIVSSKLNPKLNKADYNNLSSQLVKSISDDMQILYLQQLSIKNKVKVNNKVISALFDK